MHIIHVASLEYITLIWIHINLCVMSLVKTVLSVKNGLILFFYIIMLCMISWMFLNFKRTTL